MTINTYINKNRRNTFLLLVFICFLFLLLAFSESSKNNTYIQLSPTPTPGLISTLPNPGEQYFLTNNQPLNFIFNFNLSKQQPHIKFNPPIPFISKISSDSKTLLIYPKTFWEYNTEYKLEITGLSVSPVNFTFKPIDPNGKVIDDAVGIEKYNVKP